MKRFIEDNLPLLLIPFIFLVLIGAAIYTGHAADAANERERAQLIELARASVRCERAP